MNKYNNALRSLQKNNLFFGLINQKKLTNCYNLFSLCINYCIIYKSHRVIKIISTVGLHGGMETNEILDHKKHEKIVARKASKK
jgi:hypothetical protein